MRLLPFTAALAACLTLAASALAQVRLESALRTGILLPIGDATGTASDNLRDTFGPQFPLFLDLGVQPVERLFVGAYGGIGVGGAGGDSSDRCEEEGATCIGRSARVGAQVHWHFRKRDITHPWVGYGLGYEWSRLLMSGAAGTQQVSFAGPEYAHLMFGIDFQSQELARIGILVDYSLASYTSMKVKSWTAPAVEVESFDKSTHGWLMLGLRGVILP